MARRTPVYMKHNTNGDIIAIAVGSDIVLAETGDSKGSSWVDMRHEPNIHLATGKSSKRFKLNKGKLEVKDTHEITNGKLRMKKQKKEQK